MRVLDTHSEDVLEFSQHAPMCKPMRDLQSILTGLLHETLLGTRKPSKTKMHTCESSRNGFVIIQLISPWLLSCRRCRVLRCMRGSTGSHSCR